jgi:UDP-glucose 4-epimerase
MKKILVTGGAGYIGSHVALALENLEFYPVILDNFSNSKKQPIEVIGFEVATGDIRSSEHLNAVFRKHEFYAVMHLAGLAYVGDSMNNPGDYYDCNVSGTISLLNAMVKHDVKKIIFSSTCSTYGIPKDLPITESTVQNPINPYGKSKLMVEGILRDFDSAYGVKSVSLRYFNVAGADPECRMGECHDPETHLIPLAIKAAIDGGSLSVYGDDYPTADGTCVRDYIHVQDIALAHLLGLDYLASGGKTDAFNLGNGAGFSVLDVIKCVENNSKKPVNAKIQDRRVGDPPELYCDYSKAIEVLKWKPQIPQLDVIVGHALKWYEHSLAK